MCLDRLADFKVPDPGVGWKAFSIKDVHITSYYVLTISYSVWDEYYSAWEAWGENNSYFWPHRIGELLPHRYGNGFHVFLTKNDAEEFSKYCCSDTIVLPVRFRHVVATGYQNDKKVVVATEMMILAEEP